MSHIIYTDFIISNNYYQIIIYSLKFSKNISSGAKRDRTVNLRLARAALSQLSYSPNRKTIGLQVTILKRTYSTQPKKVGLSGIEPLTSRLSGVRSNHLSYRPVISHNSHELLRKKVGRTRKTLVMLLFRKEVIQPHLPVRLPCYDLAPVTSFTLGGSFLAVRSPTSGTPGFHGLTGGVYKARERIHRAMADARLLAIPAS